MLMDLITELQNTRNKKDDKTKRRHSQTRNCH